MFFLNPLPSPSPLPLFIFVSEKCICFLLFIFLLLFSVLLIRFTLALMVNCPDCFFNSWSSIVVIMFLYEQWFVVSVKWLQFSSVIEPIRTTQVCICRLSFFLFNNFPLWFIGTMASVKFSPCSYQWLYLIFLWWTVWAVSISNLRKVSYFCSLKQIPVCSYTFRWSNPILCGVSVSSRSFSSTCHVVFRTPEQTCCIRLL